MPSSQVGTHGETPRRPLQVNDHIAEAVSGRSKDWIKMKSPAAREMVVKKAEKTRTHFIFRIEHLAALGTFGLA
jgi:hypothetical protein